MPRVTLTQSVFVERMSKISPKIEIIGQYTGRKNKVECRCLACGSEWSAAAGNLLVGSGCERCARISRRLSHEDFVKRAEISNPYIEILSQYELSNKHVNCRCKKCGHEWGVKPNNILIGRGCPNCGVIATKKRCTKSHEAFVSEMRERWPSIIVLSEYRSSKVKVWLRCESCGNEWFASPSNLLSGFGCPKCWEIRKPYAKLKTHEQYVAEVFAINPSIRVVGEYKGAKRYIQLECLMCGFSWRTHAGSVLGGSGCPACEMSYGEQSIRNFLNNKEIEFEYTKTFDGLIGTGGGLLSYDFYIPRNNMLIEYQGQYHDGTVYNQSQAEFDRQKIHDRRKREYAEQHGYKLLEIWYQDFNRVSEILENNII